MKPATRFCKGQLTNCGVGTTGLNHALGSFIDGESIVVKYADANSVGDGAAGGGRDGAFEAVDGAFWEELLNGLSCEETDPKHQVKDYRINYCRVHCGEVKTIEKC